MPETSTNIHKALMLAQQEISVPKGEFNSFNKYHYRSLDGILRVAKPICTKYGISLTMSEKATMIGDWHYLESTATATLVDDPAQQISVTTPVREPLQRNGTDTAQLTGACVTYARKYSLCGLLAINDGPGDPDKNGPPSKPAPLTCSSCGKTIVDFDLNGHHYSADSLKTQSILRYGQALCGNCFHSCYKAEKAAEKQSRV